MTNPKSSAAVPGPASQAVTFACTLQAGRDAAVALRDFLTSRDLDEQFVFACELALTEACNNAVQHAGSSGKAVANVASAVCMPDHVELRVTDHTEGFDLAVAVPLVPKGEKGRGLHLIHAFMDDVRYLRGQGENVIVMRKYLRPGPKTEK